MPELSFQANFNDFTVKILEFEGKLDLEEFLDWMHIVACVFGYEQVPEDNKVKLVALRLRKCASLWWTNPCAKRVRERKPKIRTWEKMKAMIKARFLPLTYG